MSRMDKRYMENGCDRCWSCKNRIGQSRDVDSPPGIDNLGIILLPECRVTGRYMTIVYDNPCRAYEHTNEGG